MQTTLWEWATAQGMTMDDLAARIGYSRRHLARIKNHGPVTRQFRRRVIIALGDWAQGLFLPSVSENSQTMRDKSNAA